MGLRKINTIGIKQANKVMHMTAMAYNIKKYLKFITKKAKSNKQTLAFYVLVLKMTWKRFLSRFASLNFSPKLV